MGIFYGTPEGAAQYLKSRGYSDAAIAKATGGGSGGSVYTPQGQPAPTENIIRIEATGETNPQYKSMSPEAAYKAGAITQAEYRNYTAQGASLEVSERALSERHDFYKQQYAGEYTETPIRRDVSLVSPRDQATAITRRQVEVGVSRDERAVYTTTDLGQQFISVSTPQGVEQFAVKSVSALPSSAERAILTVEEKKEARRSYYKFFSGNAEDRAYDLEAQKILSDPTKAIPFKFATGWIGSTDPFSFKSAFRSAELALGFKSFDTAFAEEKAQTAEQLKLFGAAGAGRPEFIFSEIAGSGGGIELTAIGLGGALGAGVATIGRYSPAGAKVFGVGTGLAFGGAAASDIYGSASSGEYGTAFSKGATFIAVSPAAIAGFKAGEGLFLTHKTIGIETKIDEVRLDVKKKITYSEYSAEIGKPTVINLFGKTIYSSRTSVVGDLATSSSNKYINPIVKQNEFLTLLKNEGAYQVGTLSDAGLMKRTTILGFERLNVKRLGDMTFIAQEYGKTKTFVFSQSGAFEPDIMRPRSLTLFGRTLFSVREGSEPSPKNEGSLNVFRQYNILGKKVMFKVRTIESPYSSFDTFTDTAQISRSPITSIRKTYFKNLKIYEGVETDAFKNHKGGTLLGYTYNRGGESKIFLTSKYYKPETALDLKARGFTKEATLKHEILHRIIPEASENKIIEYTDTKIPKLDRAIKLYFSEGTAGNRRAEFFEKSLLRKKEINQFFSVKDEGKITYAETGTIEKITEARFGVIRLKFHSTDLMIKPELQLPPEQRVYVSSGVRPPLSAIFNIIGKDIQGELGYTKATISYAGLGVKDTQRSDMGRIVDLRMGLDRAFKLNMLKASELAKDSRSEFNVLNSLGLESSQRSELRQLAATQQTQLLNMRQKMTDRLALDSPRVSGLRAGFGFPAAFRPRSQPNKPAPRVKLGIKIRDMFGSGGFDKGIRSDPLSKIQSFLSFGSATEPKETPAIFRRGRKTLYLDVPTKELIGKKGKRLKLL